MNLPHNSPYRMEYVCWRIQQSIIADAKLNSTGYHRGCYQSLQRIRSVYHSPRRKRFPRQKLRLARQLEVPQ